MGSRCKVTSETHELGNRSTSFWEEKKTRLELWEEHLIDPMRKPWNKALKCPWDSLCACAQRLVESLS